MTGETATISSDKISVTVTSEDAQAFMQHSDRLKKSSASDNLIQQEAARVDAESPPLFKPVNIAGVSGERLLQLIERIERLEEEKAGTEDDIRDVYAESKSAGFETKIMRQIVKLRKMDRQKRQEQEELLELYKSAIGLE